jgi:hypothetical protein
MLHEDVKRTQDRKPNAYVKLNLEDEIKLTLAIDLIARN